MDDASYDPVRRDLASRLKTLKRCAGRGCQKHPALRLEVSSNGRRLRDGACPPSDLDLRIAGRDRRRVSAAVTFIGRRRVARASSEPDAQRIRKPRVLPGRRYRLRVRADLRDGRRLTLDRRLRGCA